MQIYPPPAPPLERDGCCATIDNNKIYRYLPEIPPPSLRAGRGRGWVDYWFSLFCDVYRVTTSLNDSTRPVVITLIKYSPGVRLFRVTRWLLSAG